MSGARKQRGDPTEDRVVPLAPKGKGRQRCPLCNRPTVHQYRPFCSKRCADVDLGRWMIGTYRIEADENPDSGSDEE